MASLKSGMQGALKKLLITACSVDQDTGKISLKSGVDNQFQVMLNPETYEHTKRIEYTKSQAIGESGNNPRFNKAAPEDFTISIVLDGTGAVRDYATLNLDQASGLPSEQALSVREQLKKLYSVVYEYKGIDHEPQIVRLLWGSLLFYGRLSNINVKYTLFKPSGDPLRATVKLDFTGFVSREESSLAARTSSPDLTHIIEVKAGDSLPLLCNQVYKDSSYYLDVAKANGLSHFRNIKAGQKLFFPPLS